MPTRAGTVSSAARTRWTYLPTALPIEWQGSCPSREQFCLSASLPGSLVGSQSSENCIESTTEPRRCTEITDMVRAPYLCPREKLLDHLIPSLAPFKPLHPGSLGPASWCCLTSYVFPSNRMETPAQRGLVRKCP